MKSRKMRKVLPITMAAIMVASCLPAMAAEDPYSIADATKKEVVYTVDGEEIKVTQYIDTYLEKTGELNDAQWDNALVNVYVPEGADENSPIVYKVNNGGWQGNGYSEDFSKGSFNVSSDSSTEGMVLKEGCVLVTAGLRNRNQDEQSPVTVADAKAVIRYIKHNEGNVAGDVDRIFITGTSGGGALSAAIGASGNSEDYTAELEAIGACMDQTDDVFGVIAFCPITDLGHADGSYEFTYAGVRYVMDAKGIVEDINLSITDKTLELAPSLAADWAKYVNGLGVAGSDNAFDTTAMVGSGTIYESMEELLLNCLQGALDELGEEEFVKQVSAREVYNYAEREGRGGKMQTDGYKNADVNEDITGWYEIKDGKIVNFDLEEYLYYVAIGQVLKPAPAFTNAGTSQDVGFNENNIFGAPADKFGADKNKDGEKDVIGYTNPQGFGVDVSGLAAAYDNDWNKYWAANGELIETQMNMTDSIYYLANEDGDTAPYWWVRHGSLDRDTGFANQTLLYHAMKADAAIETVDFEFAFGKGHTGDYALDDVNAFMKESLAAAEEDTTTPPADDEGTTPPADDEGTTAPEDDKKPADKNDSPKTADSFGFLAVAVVAAAGLAFATRRRVAR